MQPASQPDSSVSDHFGDEAAELASYRTPSALAITGLLVGAASPLCFVAPILMFIPAVGAAISLVALRRIANSDGALVGRTAALGGLALSVVCASAAIAGARAARYLHVRQATQLGPPFIELLLEGRVNDAFRLTSAGAVYDPMAAIDEPPPPGSDPFEQFKVNPAVKALSEAGSDADIRFERTIAYERDGGECWVRQVFLLTTQRPNAADKTSAQRQVEVVLTILLRQLPGESRWTWLVASVDLAGEPDQ